MICVSELPTDPGPGICLRCPKCAERYSAQKGDYFLAKPDQVMRCTNGHRAVNLQLVHVSETIKVVPR